MHAKAGLSEDSVRSLQFAHVADQERYLFVFYAFDGFHVAERPVMLSRSVAYGEPKSLIRMMAGVVVLVQQGRSFIGALAIQSVTGRAFAHEEGPALTRLRRKLGYGNLLGTGLTRAKHKDCSQRDTAEPDESVQVYPSPCMPEHYCGV